MSDTVLALLNVAVTLGFWVAVVTALHGLRRAVQQQAQDVSTVREDVNFLYDKVVSIEDDIYEDEVDVTSEVKDEVVTPVTVAEPVTEPVADAPAERGSE